MNGILLVNKPTEMTSRDVVNQVSKKLGTKKVGHTGTLDPLATGVLVITVGTATKLTEILTAEEKEYIAEVTLGTHTDTLDCTGQIQQEEDTTHISKEAIEQALKQMTKTYDQEVPLYSAVKVNGKKLYEYARAGKEVVLPKKEVTIKTLKLLSEPEHHKGKTIFQIHCRVSKGTYIRSLIRDLAQTLDTIGIMSSLTRTKQGTYDIEACHNLEEISKEKIIPLKEVLNDYPQIVYPNEADIQNGKIIDNIYHNEEVVFLNHAGTVLAIYKTYEKDKTKLKPWKMLEQKHSI